MSGAVPEPRVRLEALDTLWVQVGGTVCNLACTHCLVSSSPTNRTHEPMSYDEVLPYLDEAVRLGVREYYFTGGEPFLNPDLERILEAALARGPATVLTNALTLDRATCERLGALARRSQHSFDVRVSLDGADAASNDAIRGRGTFDRVVRAIARLAEAGIEPVVTVTEACAGAATADGRRRLLDLLRGLGLGRPRLKVLPVFRIGAEAARSRAYESWQRLGPGDVPPGGFDHLPCSTSRAVTARGVWVCPILVNEPSARMGAVLADALTEAPLRHSACWTCHVEGATCRT